MAMMLIRGKDIFFSSLCPSDVEKEMSKYTVVYTAFRVRCTSRQHLSRHLTTLQNTVMYLHRWLTGVMCFP